ncbi:MAG: hypothetical protein CL802_13665 [Citromicrobium sp.]|nr:hypothetical protein [Citromicrobium sp.]|tara:strand:+ start:319 stop:540 length:222 start_codon:yes stop_codon:yes gene_type:complete
MTPFLYLAMAIFNAAMLPFHLQDRDWLGLAMNTFAMLFFGYGAIIEAYCAGEKAAHRRNCDGNTVATGKPETP